MIDRFHEIECEYFSIQTSGIKLWPLIRESVYQSIYAQHTKTSMPNKSDKERDVVSKLYSLFTALKNSIIYLFQNKPKVDILVLNHPRKKMQNYKYIDIYTDPLLDQVSYKYLVLESMFQLQHMKPSYQKNIVYADILEYWPRVISILKKSKLSYDERKPWLMLQDSILKEYNVSIDIINKIETELVRYRITTWCLEKLLRQIEPKIIIQVVGYKRLNKYVNDVANKLGIPTVELQHGYISKQHIAYNYPEGINNVSTFPKYLALWGEYYRDQIKIPISNNSVIVSGFKYFDNYRNRDKQSENDQTQLLFISQGTIGSQLCKIARDVALILSNEEKIVYKLHPSELVDAHENYKSLYKLGNVKVDDSMTSDMYSGIIDSTIVIGVYSTALIEAVCLGRKVIIVGLSGWTSMKELINDPRLSIAYCEPDAIELSNMIKSMSIEESDSSVYRGSALMSPYDDSFLDKLFKITL